MSKKTSLIFIILICSNTLQELGQTEWSFEWINNAECWINEFIMGVFAYQLSNIMLAKVKSSAVKETISFGVALIVNNSIRFDYSYIKNQNSKEWIIFSVRIIFAIVSTVIILVLAYKRGREKQKIKIQNDANKIIQWITNMSPEEKSQIYNCYQLIKKQRGKIEKIEEFGGMQAIEEFVRIDKEMKKD